MASNEITRRTILQGAGGAILALPFGVALTSCSSGGAPTNTATARAAGSPTNPFGLAANSTINALIFNGGNGLGYVQAAAALVEREDNGVRATVAPMTNVSQTMQPRFISGDVPDLISNNGANAIGWGQIESQLDTLDELMKAKNFDGNVISTKVFNGTLTPGTFGSRFIALNYVLTLYGVWYSAALYKENGWNAPVTWDDAIELGAKAKRQGKYLFTWGKEAATYYQTLAVGSAIKEAGDAVRLPLENLEAKCWSIPTVQEVFGKLKECIDRGYFIPGGAGTQFTAAQAQWSTNEEAILYPSGSWIANEMKAATKAGFEMTGVPSLSLTDKPKLTVNGLHAEAGTPFCVPLKAKNAPGGKEILRAMLSSEIASGFSKANQGLTVLLDTVPADGFGSTSLVSQNKMLKAAGSNTFAVRFPSLYGMNPAQLVPWNSFLAGQISVAELTAALQVITDQTRENGAIKKTKVS